MKAVPYLRTSTDDKGQDPERQLDLITRWAEGEKIELLPAVTDEGTSAAKVAPFNRPKFMQALEQAEAAEAALVVESVDRFTREGVKMFYVNVNRIESGGVRLLIADVGTVAFQESFAGEIVIAMKAALAKDWHDRHVRAVVSGMARKIAQGVKMGRPAKPVSKTEVDIILTERGKKPPTGWHTLAHMINERRGVFSLVDPEAVKRRKISHAQCIRIHQAVQKNGRLKVVESLEAEA